ncbi:hypothetical protein B0O99DRAFT_637454 [Bisporella sp. PMI_857]|nr:hypothetical protein B0O99DRAFT_637454 [Bisporella sp. PMI_857]
MLLIYLYFAERPLTIAELLAQLSVLLGKDPTNFYLAGRIKSACSGLVMVSAEREVELFHYSLRECLAERYKSGDGHSTLAKACLEYLLKDYLRPIPWYILASKLTEQTKSS